MHPIYLEKPKKEMSLAQKKWKGFRVDEEIVPVDPAKVPGLKYWKKGDEVVIDKRGKK